MVSKKRKLGLRIVNPGEEITGIAPVSIERVAKSCRHGSVEHRALVRTCGVVADHALRQAMPPSAQRQVIPHLDVALAWSDSEAAESLVKKARSEAFAAILGAEKKALEAVLLTQSQLQRKMETGLDRHAETVVQRYGMLAANYGSGAVILTLDAIDDPLHALKVVSQAAGAVAYARAGLGPALGSRMRAAAWETAEWESERPGALDTYPTGALAVQLLHEYLGSWWKDQSDGLRIFYSEFCDWALAPALRKN